MQDKDIAGSPFELLAMDTSNYGKGNNNTDTVMEAAESRGMKRSSSHLDLDELPEDSKENEFQERRAKKQMQQYEVNYQTVRI